MHLTEFWNETLSLIKSSTDASEFQLYFSELTVDYGTENNLTVYVPSTFFRDRLKVKFEAQIKSTLKELTGHDIDINFKVRPKETRTETKKENEPLTEKEVQKPAQNSSDIKATPKKNHVLLNPDYTFSNFIVGGNNEFAYNCALAISKDPGLNYNPLMLYGGVGLGKTHLMQAIGNAIYVNNPKANIIYIPSESFMMEFFASIQNKTQSQFKNKYRNVDALLLDDIHDLENKKETQEELFNTFNALYQARKQLVFTCDRPPQELKDFAGRLLSRLTLGVNADLQIPSWETRFVILKKKAEQKNIKIPDDVLEIIARKITTNVRDLQAAMNQVTAYAEIINSEVTLEIAQNLLKNIFAGPVQQSIPIDLVQKVVAEFYKLSVQDLKGKKRTQAITLPRQVAMYIIREMTEFSTTEVGTEFGGRDHTTVMHAVQKIADKLKTEPSFDAVIQNLQRIVRERASNS
ncbi:MAG: chromosomal replication initiator protein DnaA [Spirochaetales bacterium]|nr:chromosomal replication initiator protein DnaA [Spirochaetales bacterium]